MFKRNLIFIALFAFLLFGFLFQKNLSPNLTPTPLPLISPTLSPTSTPANEKPDCCSLDKKLQGWKCIRTTCVGIPYPPQGALVEKCINPKDPSFENDPCPLKCLSSATFILTSAGKVNVKDLKIGMKIYTLSKKGVKELQPILKLSKIRVGNNQQIYHLVLDDMREVYLSPEHPTLLGKPAKSLQVGEMYDKSRIKSNTLVDYQDEFTYDLLPDGETGIYFANDIPLLSTLK